MGLSNNDDQADLMPTAPTDYETTETADAVGIRSIALLADFVQAARKQEKAIHSEFGGWGHALWCNYQRDEGNGNGRCNCGVSDMLTALRNYDSANKNIYEHYTNPVSKTPYS